MFRFMRAVHGNPEIRGLSLRQLHAETPGTETPRVLTSQTRHAKLTRMKSKKVPVEKASVGTVVGAKYRARCNELTNSEREKLNDEFLKLYYADSTRQPARRR